MHSKTTNQRTKNPARPQVVPGGQHEVEGGVGGRGEGRGGEGKLRRAGRRVKAF